MTRRIDKGVTAIRILVLFIILLTFSGCGHIEYANKNDDTKTAFTEIEGDGQPEEFEGQKPEYESLSVQNVDDDNLPIPVFAVETIPDSIKEVITGKSYKDNTPFDYSELSYLTITYNDFNGERQVGDMIVASEIGNEVLEIFEEIYESGFTIDKIRLVDIYDGDDDLSMEDNNTSAFNFRYITNSDTISKHGYGVAIDINPVQNPYVSGDTILPAAGSEYVNRSDLRGGMIVKGDSVYEAFTSRGWVWGGDWDTPKDYQHFEKP